VHSFRKGILDEEYQIDVCSLRFKNTSSKYRAVGKEKASEFKIWGPLVSNYGRHRSFIERRKKYLHNRNTQIKQLENKSIFIADKFHVNFFLTIL